MGRHEGGADIAREGPQEAPARVSYLASIQKHAEGASERFRELEARLGPVMSPGLPKVLRGEKADESHNLISNVNKQLAILNDRIDHVLSRLEI